MCSHEHTHTEKGRERNNLGETTHFIDEFYFVIPVKSYGIMLYYGNDRDDKCSHQWLNHIGEQRNAEQRRQSVPRRNIQFPLHKLYANQEGIVLFRCCEVATLRCVLAL